MRMDRIVWKDKPHVRELMISFAGFGAILLVIGGLITLVSSESTGFGVIASTTVTGVEQADVNFIGLSFVFFSAAILLWAASRVTGALQMSLLSWALFLPFAVGFHMITLVSVSGVEFSNPILGAIPLGFVTLAPWWYYFWAGASVAIIAWFMTASELPKWPPRRFIIWPWVTGLFIALIWPTKLLTELIGTDIGNWSLSTGWTQIFNDVIYQPIIGESVSSMTFDFDAHWGQFFLFWWLLHAFVVWTVFVYARRIRVGKDNYADGSI